MKVSLNYDCKWPYQVQDFEYGCVAKGDVLLLVLSLRLDVSLTFQHEALLQGADTQRIYGYISTSHSLTYTHGHLHSYFKDTFIQSTFVHYNKADLAF